MRMTKVLNVKKTGGIAGQVRYTAVVQYPGEDSSTVSFVGSVYGGPVVMVTEGWPDGVFVTEPGQYGKFSPAWVRNFFEKEH
jgi:hypothetical protein